MGRERNASLPPLFDKKAFITREHNSTVFVSVFPGSEGVPLREANTVNTDQGNWMPLTQTSTCPPLNSCLTPTVTAHSPASEETALQSSPTLPAGYYQYKHSDVYEEDIASVSMHPFTIHRLSNHIS